MMDTEAIAWAAQKLQAFAVDHSSMDNAMMMDRLYSMLQAEPTPLAQEAEPIYQICEDPQSKAYIDVPSKNEYQHNLNAGYKGRILYTRPDQSELVKAAWVALRELYMLRGSHNEAAMALHKTLNPTAKDAQEGK